MDNIEDYLRTAYNIQVPYSKHIENLATLYTLGEVPLEMVLKAVDKQTSINSYSNGDDL